MPGSMLEAAICESEQYEFNGQWLDQPGTYTDTLQNALGCGSIVGLTLQVHPVVDTAIEVTFQAGGAWNGIPIHSDTSFTEVYTTTFGCDSLVLVTIQVVTSTTEPASDAWLRVIPNPADDRISIVWEGGEGRDVQLAIRNIAGQEVWTQTTRTGSSGQVHRFEIPTANWPAGVYLVHWQDGRRHRLLRFVVAH